MMQDDLTEYKNMAVAVFQNDSGKYSIANPFGYESINDGNGPRMACEYLSEREDRSLFVLANGLDSELERNVLDLLIDFNADNKGNKKNLREELKEQILEEYDLEIFDTYQELKTEIEYRI